MLCQKVIYCFCRVPSMHAIEIQTYDLLCFWLACSLFVCLFFASLTHGFDPRLFYGHSLASDSVTLANLISVYDFGTNKQPRVNSSPGLRLTPVPGITLGRQGASQPMLRSQRHPLFTTLSLAEPFCLFSFLIPSYRLCFCLFLFTSLAYPFWICLPVSSHYRPWTVHWLLFAYCPCTIAIPISRLWTYCGIKDPLPFYHIMRTKTFVGFMLFISYCC